MGVKTSLAAGSVDRSFWCGRSVLITGHTGFKGSWLSLWLQSMGANVHGLALAAATEPNLFDVASVKDGLLTSAIGDIRDLGTVMSVMREATPEVVIHMAAQPLVRRSYAEPVETFATNVMGSVHVLEAARKVGSVRAIVNVTTDKCYDNREWVWAYREDEPMGGFDPYSSSKGCAELLTSAYRRSFMEAQGIGLASARAGNVIGGGDWATDRLVPDTLAAFERGEEVTIRHPDAIRPWQHVLEPLSGYLVLAQHLYAEPAKFNGAWNFGPHDDDARSVRWIVDRLTRIWGGNAGWRLDSQIGPHEATFLKLDISKARSRLRWEPRWDLATALDYVTEWHRNWLAGFDMQEYCLEQIKSYQTNAHNVRRREIEE